jgi:hypothetical protein
MGAAMQVAVAAAALDDVAAAAPVTIPAHWSGRAAQGYQRTASNLARSLAALAAAAHESAALTRQHEIESAAVSAALASGGLVAV